MKKHILLLSLFLVSCFAYSQNTWTQKADFGGGNRTRAVGFSIGNFGYIGTGMDSSGYRKDFWKWDSMTNTWTQISDFGGSARILAVAFAINGKGYVGTGVDAADLTKDFWEYDPAANTWTQKADFGGTRRRWAFSFAMNGKGYVGTGTDSAGHCADFWEYEASTDLWTQKAGFQGGVRYGATGVSDGINGYVGCGSPDFIPLNDFWMYDPALDTWTQKVNLPASVRAYAVGFSLYGKIYMGTGLDANPPPYGAIDFWQYDVPTNTWLQIANLPAADVHEAVGFSINGKGYLGTGTVPGSYENYFYEYAPTVGLEEYSGNDNGVLFYPNPFNVTATVTSEVRLVNATLIMYNCSGQEVKQISNISGQKFSLSRDNLPGGIYCCKITDINKNTFIKKIVLQ